MGIETIINVIAAAMGFALPEGIISINAPVAINDSLALNCLEQSKNAEELMEALGLPAKWNSDETMGYLLSCSEQGHIIDSLPAYYWNSEGYHLHQ